MRPGTGGCADTKDPALIGCDEEEAESVDACPPRIYVRLNDREWGGGGRDPPLIFGGSAAERVGEALQDWYEAVGSV